MGALDNFIGALGARYDGDPRIGFIMIGLIGFWGEWHTYPYDGNLKPPNLMPTDANLKRVLTDMDKAFDSTKLVLRYPMDNATLKTTDFDVGYHDDSFAFQTLPPSLGGQSWHFWGRIKDASATEFWKTNSMGGEMRPEIQVKMWNNDPPRYNEPATPIEGAQGEDYYTSLNLTHASWLIAQGIFQTPLAQEPLARATEGSRKMGYEYYVPTAYLDVTGGSLKVGVELENRGVAPFYYNWRVELAAQTENGIVKIWDPGWNLKDILPNTNGFDGNKLFESASNPVLSNGTYQILMRYVNPLEQINADAKPFRFANADQNADGWLDLGSVVVSGSAAEAPVRVSGIAAATAEQLRLAPGKSMQINVAAAPVEASNTRVVWSSANSAVAYVSAAGLVKAVGVGQTVITAKTSDGNIAKQFQVTVSSGSEPETDPPSGTIVAPQTPAQEKTKDGVKLGQDAVKTAHTKNADGVTETTATIDATRLKEAFDALSKQASTTFNTVSIDVKNDGGSVKVELPSSALVDAADNLPGASILVQTDLGSYKVPVSVLGLYSMAEKLGVNPEGMTIRIEINKVGGAAAETLSAQAAKDGLNLLAPSLEYNIFAEANGKSVEIADFGRNYVERTMILSGPVDPSKMTALLYDSDAGAFRFVPAVFQASGDHTVAVIKRNGNSIYTVASGSKTFADLNGHWAKVDIESLASKRIVNGVTPSSFSPNQSITRAEFAALLVRSLGLSAPAAAASFSDVAEADWYSGAVEQAVHAGLIEGYQDGTFKPNDRITREQMAVMLFRALKYVGQSALAGDTEETILAKYADQGAIGAWAKPAVAQLLATDIIQGRSATTIDPTANASRAEALVMLKRFLQLVQFMN